MATYQLNVNGQRRDVETDPTTPLLWVLREDLKMTGTKYGCGISACGACTALVRRPARWFAHPQRHIWVFSNQ